MRNANLAQMDAQWRAYVNADPDLRRLEHRKQSIAHRRICVAHAKKVRREAGQAILNDLIEMGGLIASATVFAALLFLMFIMA